jgi:hypothetical protein
MTASRRHRRVTTRLIGACVMVGVIGCQRRMHFGSADGQQTLVPSNLPGTYTLYACDRSCQPDAVSPPFAVGGLILFAPTVIERAAPSPVSGSGCVVIADVPPVGTPRRGPDRFASLTWTVVANVLELTIRDTGNAQSQSPFVVRALGAGSRDFVISASRSSWRPFSRLPTPEILGRWTRPPDSAFCG